MTAEELLAASDVLEDAAAFLETPGLVWSHGVPATEVVRLSMSPPLHDPLLMLRAAMSELLSGVRLTGQARVGLSPSARKLVGLLHDPVDAPLWGEVARLPAEMERSELAAVLRRSAGTAKARVVPGAGLRGLREALHRPGPLQAVHDSSGASVVDFVEAAERIRLRHPPGWKPPHGRPRGPASDGR